MKTVLLRSPDSPAGNGSAPRSSGLISEPPPPKIQAFSQGLSGATRKAEDGWKRQATVTGNGAVHVKSFHCKLAEESLAFLDQQVNDWLEAHPQYEVKFVTTAIGEWQGKIKEPQMVVQLWL